jgi:hypothetical protein
MSRKGKNRFAHVPATPASLDKMQGIQVVVVKDDGIGFSLD